MLDTGSAYSLREVSALLRAVPALQCNDCSVPLEPALEQHMCTVRMRWFIDVTLHTNTGSLL